MSTLRAEADDRQREVRAKLYAARFHAYAKGRGALNNKKRETFGEIRETHSDIELLLWQRCPLSDVNGVAISCRKRSTEDEVITAQRQGRQCSVPLAA